MTKKIYIIIFCAFLTILLGLVSLYLITKKEVSKKNKYSDEYLKYQEIFNFELSDNKEYYIIKGLKKAHYEDNLIIIPDYIDLIPVRKLVDEENEFMDWHSIQSIYLGKNIEYIGTHLDDDGIFNGGTYGEKIFNSFNSNLTSIEVDKENKVFAGEDGVLYNKDYTVLIKYPHQKVSDSGIISYTVKEGVVEIYQDAFYNNSVISYINLPISVKKIGNNAFYNCKMLSKITFSNNIESIDYDAFNGCNLTSITLPSKLMKLGSRAFARNSELLTCYIPESVVDFGSNIFTGSPSNFKILTSKDNLTILKNQEKLKGLIIEEVK